MKISERRVCRALGQHRSTQRQLPRGCADEERLVADMIELTRQYGRYGYRRVAALLRDAGWQVNDKRVERLWRREGLKVPMKQPKKGRMRDELLNGEIFYSLREAQIIIERWRNHYNTKRPHSALGYRPPAPEATIPVDQRPVMH